MIFFFFSFDCSTFFMIGDFRVTLLANCMFYLRLVLPSNAVKPQMNTDALFEYEKKKKNILNLCSCAVVYFVIFIRLHSDESTNE